MPIYSDWRVDELNGYWYRMHYRTGWRHGPAVQLQQNVPLQLDGPLTDRWADMEDIYAARTRHVTWRVVATLAHLLRRVRARMLAVQELGVMLALASQSS